MFSSYSTGQVTTAPYRTLDNYKCFQTTKAPDVSGWNISHEQQKQSVFFLEESSVA